MPIFSAYARNTFRAVYREPRDVHGGCDGGGLIDVIASFGVAFRDNWLTQWMYHD